MIMPIAIARDGFIDFDRNSEDTLQGFLDNLTFENKDLQFFDGNTCNVVNAYDPTNSVFIYENQQGRFLYTITSATPLIHKNNKIWKCNCFEMVNLNDYDDLIKSNDRQTIFDKLVFNKGIFVDTNLDTRQIKTKVKNNFISMQQYKVPFVDRLLRKYFTLKIKCYVNPTTIDLKTEAPDGSYNFLFPLRIEENLETFKIEKFTTKISNDVGTIIVSLADVISKYSPNIKSIELLPFEVKNIGNETLLYDTLLETDYVNLFSGGVFTDCGFFVKSNYSFNYENLLYDTDLLPSFEKEFVFGGGIRGFLQTPLGNIELSFNSELYDEFSNAKYLILEDGFKIDGKFKCTVPPHYLNFYTDNAGQVFIQNLTTNAQELRQLERENVAKYEEQQQQRVLNALTSASNINPLNIGDYINFGKNLAIDVLKNEYLTGSGGQFEREYKRSLAEYEDKKQTQSLLASMTGKEITGQFGIIDFLKNVNNKYFCFYFETNFYKNSNGYIISQPDYDYSIDVENVNYNLTDVNYTTFNYPINYIASFIRFVIVQNRNNQEENRFSKNITLFLRNRFPRLP